MHIYDANKIFQVQEDLNCSNDALIYHQMSENKVLESFWKLKFLSPSFLRINPSCSWRQGDVTSSVYYHAVNPPKCFKHRRQDVLITAEQLPNISTVFRRTVTAQPQLYICVSGKEAQGEKKGRGRKGENIVYSLWKENKGSKSLTHNIIFSWQYGCLGLISSFCTSLYLILGPFLVHLHL